MLKVCHVVRGQVVEGADVEYHSRDLDAPFFTPRLDLDALVPPRTQPGPAFDLRVDEIIDFLTAVGERLTLDKNPYLQESLEHMLRVNPLPRRILETSYREIGGFLRRDVLEFQIDQEVGRAFLDGWVPVDEPSGRRVHVRAFPPRLIHVLAGNAPGVAAMSIVRGALVKGINVFKMPSNDLFTATAVLRTMADVDPDHPVLRSMSAVYWRGGDDRVEGVLYRPQFFDKLVAWGGEGAIGNAVRYLGPGFQLISFDPKVSISIIGREAFASEQTLREVAALAASDATAYNQDACVCARHQYVEGDLDEVDRYCEILAEELAVDRPYASAVGPDTPGEIRDEVDVLRHLEPAYRVWGGYDGRGLVVRSEDPVEFYPTAKTVNIVPVPSLADAVRFATVATQTVGVYPPSRTRELRDALACAGVQRVVALGGALEGAGGLPHDAMYPLHRFVRWIVDERDASPLG